MHIYTYSHVYLRTYRCICIYIYIHMSKYTYICTYMWAYICGGIYGFKHMRVFTGITHTRAYICICTHVCKYPRAVVINTYFLSRALYPYIYIYIYIYTYIYTYVCTRPRAHRHNYALMLTCEHRYSARVQTRKV